MFSGKDNNLHTSYTQIVCHDGIFDDFQVSTTTSAQFTANSINTATFTQDTTDGGGRGYLFTSHTGVAQTGVYYQNMNALAPARAFPWVTYCDIILETSIYSEGNGYTNLAGFAIVSETKIILMLIVSFG